MKVSRKHSKKKKTSALVADVKPGMRSPAGFIVVTSVSYAAALNLSTAFPGPDDL
jgi:hypothetical protein